MTDRNLALEEGVSEAAHNPIADFILAQREMGSLLANKNNSYFNSEYADLSAVLDVIKIPLNDHGFAIIQGMDVKDSRIVLNTTFLHRGGYSFSSCMLLPDIQNPQQLGSAITYYRRYQLISLSGLPTKDDDSNDAAEAVEYQKNRKVVAPKVKSEPCLSSEQMATIKKLINGNDHIKAMLKERYPDGAEKVPASNYDKVIAFINQELSDEAGF
jgi:uncharacterized protein involved in tellurium resistance